MNRRGTIWLQRLHSHHLHQSHGQHPIPRVGKNWDCYLQTFKKTILRTQVSSQLWNKQQTNINHNLKQHNKKTKKTLSFFFALLPSTFPFLPLRSQLLLHRATSQHRTIGFYRGGTAAKPGCQSRGRRPVACRSTEHRNQVPWAKKILLQLLRKSV